MRLLIALGGMAAAAVAVAGCQTDDRYAMSACERDYAQNRDRAIAAGALVGGAIGVAIDDNDYRGGALGAVVGGAIASQITRENDPCGYGFGGYAYNDRYGYDDRPYGNGYYDRYGRWQRR